MESETSPFLSDKQFLDCIYFDYLDLLLADRAARNDLLRRTLTYGVAGNKALADDIRAALEVHDEQ